MKILNSKIAFPYDCAINRANEDLRNVVQNTKIRTISSTRAKPRLHKFYDAYGNTFRIKKKKFDHLHLYNAHRNDSTNCVMRLFRKYVQEHGISDKWNFVYSKILNQTFVRFLSVISFIMLSSAGLESSHKSKIRYTSDIMRYTYTVMWQNPEKPLFSSSFIFLLFYVLYFLSFFLLFSFFIAEDRLSLIVHDNESRIWKISLML